MVLVDGIQYWSHDADMQLCIEHLVLVITGKSFLFIATNLLSLFCTFYWHLANFPNIIQEDKQNACSSDVHSTQLGKTSKQDVPRVVSSGLLPNVPAPHITQTKLHSASNDVITNSSKDERQDKKEFEGGEELLNHQENLVTVDIFADFVSSRLWTMKIECTLIWKKGLLC